ncbi:M20/M25/M40 family metallo-hydrolase [Virgibacillus sp. C22-A2]|uniref:M20/M25/M40 family metallo-hydrolase n=1 Tax=Virgibacillus tibetensis TaxID=3042313 RepID=A0ABU6KN64_9BACI|nr:M20/M25/M40 family metallo-hydrolase [Virgibacillus sp. C22-A2]
MDRGNISKQTHIYAKISKSNKSYKSIMFNGHIDTVPAYTMENGLQPERKKENLYGGGAVDIKGAIAAAVMFTLNRYHREFAGEVNFAGPQEQGVLQIPASGR